MIKLLQITTQLFLWFTS